eukprot:jgi/Mesen1/2478/ME000159S01603
MEQYHRRGLEEDLKAQLRRTEGNHQGRFEILSLSGSFMPNYSEDSFMPAVNDERSRSRTGGLMLKEVLSLDSALYS